MKKAQGSILIDDEQFTKAFETWMAQRPNHASTLKTFIARIKPKLVEARAKGATYEELVGFLRQQGVECSVSTLKAYLAVKRRPKSGSKASKDKRRTDLKSPALPARTSQPGLKGGITDDQL